MENQINHTRVTKYKEEYPEEINFLETQKGNMPKDIYDIYSVFVFGHREVTSEDIKKVREYRRQKQDMRRNLLIMLGGEKEFDRFKNFVYSKLPVADKWEKNNFWVNIWKGCKGYNLTEKQIEAVRKQMKKELEEEKEDCIKAEILIATWLAKRLEISKRMKGEILKETDKSILFSGYAVAKPSEICMHCGQAITNETSKRVGYGPTCAMKLGIPWVKEKEEPSEEDVENLKNKIEGVYFKDWLSKKHIKIKYL